MMVHPRRWAFTLVELLVVIAIIGILSALLLPALQISRESAHRHQCINRLQRLGMAMGDYASAHGVLPPGASDFPVVEEDAATVERFSWIAPLLLHLDQPAANGQLNRSAGFDDPANAAVRRLRLASLICPSESYDPEALPFGVTSYAGCHHDVESALADDNHGVLFLNSRITPDDVTDGLAYTIFVGEKRLDENDSGWLSGSRATLRNTGHPLGVARDATAGQGWVGGFGSPHALGANFLFGDNSTRLLTAEIDPTVFRQLGHRADGGLLDDYSF